ncbi:hypothetical protein MferCBS31731_001825 [Microsporum ferrugineum]
MTQHTILPCTPDDTMEMAALERAAYGVEPLSNLMFGEPSSSSLDARAERFAQLIAHPTSRWFKVVVDGKMAGVAFWQFRTNTDWISELDGPEKGEEYLDQGTKGLPESGCDARRVFFNWLYGVRKRRMAGKSHALLNLLAVLPDYQRRGIGGTLLRYGLEEAQKLGVPTWLEASSEGFPLYRSHGFEVVEPFTMRLADYGGREEDGENKMWGMIKMP